MSSQEREPEPFFSSSLVVLLLCVVSSLFVISAAPVVVGDSDSLFEKLFRVIISHAR